MNVALDRLIEGIVATMRTDVIPNVADPYARGQAVGVIDLLNNIAPRIEWAHAPIAAAIAEKRALLRDVAALAPEAAADFTMAPKEGGLAERHWLDGMIGDALAVLHAASTPESIEAMALVRRHLHDEQAREMAITAKPLFAEIAGGSGDRDGSGKRDKGEQR